MNRKKRIQIIVGTVLLILGVGLAIYFIARPKAATLSVSNTVLGYYTENNINKTAQSNTVFTEILNPSSPSISPSPSKTPTPSPTSTITATTSPTIIPSPTTALTPAPSPSPSSHPAKRCKSKKWYNPICWF